MNHKNIKSLAEYRQEYEKSVSNPESFWADKAQKFVWKRKWDSVLEWNFIEPNIKWFVGGTLNITENCLDCHLQENGDRVAIIWEPNNPTEKAIKITYRELHKKVCQMANLLKVNGVQKGDRVCIYMPMIPELSIAVLACARIGAIHSVVFAGFSAESLSDRINDAKPLVLVTADGCYRGNKTIAFAPIVNEALSKSGDLIKKVIYCKRTNEHVSLQSPRDLWLHEELDKMPDDCLPVELDSEDALFILYTSGSTGKPKGVVHTVGGYMVYIDYSFRNIFQYKEGEVYWCTADIGWITGHSYVIYGPLLAGSTTLIFEGVPTFPDSGRFWQIIDKHKVNIFYTAPTAIRALMASGFDLPMQYDLNSLRVLGTVGEPINEEAWNWYNEHIGRKKCPIVDTWWQTETGGIVISPLAGITPLKPSFATLPMPGAQPIILDEEGREVVKKNIVGNLCLKFPLPSMIRTTYGDHQRCKNTYFSRFPGYYFTGDGAFCDEDGYYRIIGRVDDVINTSGHRFGTAEIEDAINRSKNVIESAVVGYDHPIKGEGIYAFVIADRLIDVEIMRATITNKVAEIIGPIAKPDKIQFVSNLPKTRSGKIMRRILRKIAGGEFEDLGDISTLLDPGVVSEIIKNIKKNHA